MKGLVSNVKDGYENTERTNRTLCGGLWQLMITDPSYVGYFDQTAEFGSPVPEGHFSYAGACNRTLANGYNGQMNFPAGHEGVGVVTRTGLGDGYYPVYATIADIDGWGERVVKIEILFV